MCMCRRNTKTGAGSSQPLLLTNPDAGAGAWPSQAGMTSADRFHGLPAVCWNHGVWSDMAISPATEPEELMKAEGYL